MAFTEEQKLRFNELYYKEVRTPDEEAELTALFAVREAPEV
jgi:hypothetical protein